MGKTRVLVVDDSVFSQTAISGLLEESGFEVCSCAATGHDAVAKYRQLEPDIVTMDYTLPDIDGLTCSRQILTINPAAQIVILSAMKDQKLITKGRALGIRAFLQKPAKQEELVQTLQMISTKSNVTGELQAMYLRYFQQALTENLKNMAHIAAKTISERKEKQKFVAHGAAIMLGITGTYQGRIILDVAQDTLVNLVQAMLGTNNLSENDMLNSIAEFANIIAGYGVSEINNCYKDVELRLTPPSILLGEALSVINQRIKSCTVVVETNAGDIYLNIGFAGGQS
ncbi:MAG: response regulator [Pelosinus sp.]|nr:response regulator [Pelosinus sp.]